MGKTLGQVKGIDPVSNEVMIYRVEDDGRVVERWNPATKSWQGQPFVCPTSFGPVISQKESQEAVMYLLNNGFKKVTAYITIGDEPAGNFVTDFEKFIGQSEAKAFFELLQSMPRQYLRAWFMESIWPKLEGGILPFKDASDSKAADLYGEKIGGKKKDEDLVWGAVIDYFNRANLEYCNKFQVEPWAWEEEKMRLFLISQNRDELQKMEQEFDATVSALTSNESQKQKLIERYNRLPKSEDPGLEVTRQAAVNRLLDDGEFDIVAGIIDSYEAAAKSGLPIAAKIEQDMKLGNFTIKKTKG